MKFTGKKSVTLILVSLLLFGLLTACGNTASQPSPAPSSAANHISLPEEVSSDMPPAETGTPYVTEDYYIFDLADSVERTPVFYTNRYGITLAGDLYVSKELDRGQTHPALVIGPPYGGVKEQGPGVYANQLAQRGFVALAFDPSYNGESGGEPRYISSPEIFSEDFSAGVDFLGSLDYVDREQIGAIGICGSGGFALSAAAMDTRIKAVATAAMYDISGMGTSMDNETRAAMLAGMTAQRWEDFENGAPAYTRNYPADASLEELPEEITGRDEEWWTFYGLKRGWHPNSGGSFTNTSMLPFMNYSLLSHIDSISPRPILFITGDIAHSRSISESVYEMAAEPKELYIVPGAMHIDLYDDVEKIPFDKLENFFRDAFGTAPATEPAVTEQTQPVDPAASQPEPAAEEQEATAMKMQVQVGDHTFFATLENNATTEALVEMMKAAPIEIQMRDYSGFEKVGLLGTSLPADDHQTTTQAGDIVLYTGNQIVMFYGSNSWSYTRLGRIDNLTGWEEALGSGDITVRLSL